MKIGIMTDIHNNIIALEEILKVFEKLKCDKIICCGDIIGIGPEPEKSIKKIMSIPNLICVCGNHEGYLTKGITRDYLPKMYGNEVAHHEWEHGLLSEESKNFIKNLPNSISINLNGLKIYISHYALDNNSNCLCICPKPTILDLQKMFNYIDADVILYGHDHFGSIIKSDKTYYINCGSLGCPGKLKNIAKAAIINIKDNDIVLDNLEIEYDVEEVVSKIKDLKYPAYEEIIKMFYGIK
ncbi:metallophosphoesterase family protein [Sedimentibacter sp. zth1]|uniref:metallophosphoesterase family protein n=1 Tax=Sedimentibacter sp. zth1 TaxID=2816908 RepID=UPI001A937C5F|nr:YfcE family phosphodiesterase [Sedimentibacter sp. zth1]QSX06502.1 metallophosphoesterase family protein [Sedimentibacter sp. zth1]